MGPEIHHLRPQPRVPQHGNGTKRRLYAGLVHIIDHQNISGIAVKQPALLRSKGSPQRGHRVRIPRLMHRYDIHVTLTDNHIFFTGSFCCIEPVQIPAFVENSCFRRIQVLGLPLSHNPAAETDHSPVHIHDGKHHPVPELISEPVSLVKMKKAGILQKLIRVSSLLHKPVKIVAVTVRITQSERMDNLVGESSVFQIIHGVFPGRRAQFPVEIFRGKLVYFQKFSLSVRLRPRLPGHFRLRKADARPVGQLSQGFLKGLVLVLH